MDKYDTEESSLRSYKETQYESIYKEDSELMDYDTLMSLALQSASIESNHRARRRQILIFRLILFSILLSVGMLTMVTFFSYPDEKHLHQEFADLETDVEDLGDEVKELNYNGTTIANETSPQLDNLQQTINTIRI